MSSFNNYLSAGGNIMSALAQLSNGQQSGNGSQFGTWGGGVPLLSASAGMSQVPDTSSSSNNIGATEPSFMDKMLGWTDGNQIEHNGWGSAALGVGQSALSGYLGLQQLGIAKDSLAENKRQFNANFENQRTLVNGQLEDRQRARVASRGGNGGYESVSSYMDKNGV